MVLNRIKEKIYESLKIKGLEKPFALAFVGSRAVGYNTPKSDYDFSAVFKNNIDFNYLNFKFNNFDISVKLQSREVFESSMNQIKSSEQSRIVFMPYFQIENKEYLELNEKKGRNYVLNSFISSLPKDEDIEVNLERIVEWPFIHRSLTTPDYTRRVRGIFKNKEGFLKIMKKKYLVLLKSRGYFVSNEGNVILNNSGDRRIPKTDFFKFTKERYNFAKGVGVNSKSYFHGGAMILMQFPYLLFNYFEKIPIIKKEKDKKIYVGPTMEEFLNKRNCFIPIENGTKRLYDRVTHDVFKRKSL